jgi:hypothetical protein
MINNRFNDLAHWDNPNADRYAVELDIISVEMHIDGGDGSDPFPLIEVLRPTIVDTQTGARTEGIVGNNFSSYVRDYDFSVVLPASNEGGHLRHSGRLRRPARQAVQALPESDAYRANFSKGRSSASACPAARPTTAPRTIIRSWAWSTARASAPHRPVLRQDGPAGALLHAAGQRRAAGVLLPGDLLGDYSNLELIGTISTMETFQKIYRPEIYNANSVAGKVYQPSLKHQDYSSTASSTTAKSAASWRSSRAGSPKSTSSSRTAPCLSSGLPADPSISHSPPGHQTQCRRRNCSPPPPQAACPSPPGWPSPKALVALEAAGRRLIEGKQDALRLSLQEQQHAGIDIVSDGEQTRQHFVTTFIEHLAASISRSAKPCASATATTPACRRWSAP